MDATRRRLLLVVGPGRSGTSTLTGVLRRVGVSVPRPEVPADESNPRGFGEPRWVVALHDELLGRAGVLVADARPDAWTRARSVASDPEVRSRLRAWLSAQLDRHERVVVKDPRLAWLLPLWSGAAADLGVEPAHLTVLRPPAEVVGSRRTRYNHALEDAHGLAGWLNLVLGAEAATRETPRVLVGYHDLLDDWRGELARIDAALGPGLLADRRAAADIDGFIDPSLRRERASGLSAPPRLLGLAASAWSALGALTGRGSDAAAAQASLDAIRAEYDAYYDECASVARSSVLAAGREPAKPPARGRRPRRPWSAARSSPA